MGVTTGSGRTKYPNPGKVNFTLLVNGTHALVFLDDHLQAKYTLFREELLDEGDLAYAVLSGTNKDYGTRCTITNAELWNVTP